VDDVARECGVGAHVLFAWWTRDRDSDELTADDVAKIVRMTPTQVGRMAEAVADWYVPAAPAADPEPAAKPRGRKAKDAPDDAPPYAEPVELDPDDLIPPGGPTTVEPAEDDIPF
jgi:hypothetical protein